MKLFVLIRKDLPSMAYKAVQAGHAVAQYLIDHPEDKWQNRTLIYSELSMVKFMKYKSKIESMEIDYSIFCEPDLNDMQTAIAFCPDDDAITRKLNLLRG